MFAGEEAQQVFFFMTFTMDILCIYLFPVGNVWVRM
jgi:hypothetical protein